ncbi:hypothetical protein ACWDE9_45785, partial [Streptomyces olivaceoviridis]
PYGGVKQSGVGREGVRFAMEDYTYERSPVTRVSPTSCGVWVRGPRFYQRWAGYSPHFVTAVRAST